MELNTPVNKKTVARRQGTCFIRGFAVLFAAGILYYIWSVRADLTSNWKNIVWTALALAGFLVVVQIGAMIDGNKILDNIRRQEKRLRISFDDDMSDVYMGGIWSGHVEAVSKGDWYVLLSAENVIAVNRRYITGIGRIERKWCETQRYHPDLIEIDFETVSRIPLTCKVGSSTQAVVDLIAWLGCPCPKIKDVDVQNRPIEVNRVLHRVKSEPEEICVREGEIHRLYAYD